MARQVMRLILNARERKQQVAVLFCDLSKAFDVADHTLLAHKLAHYGINGPALAILVDSMKDRSQIVFGDAGRVRSDPLSATMGVAQGSSLSNIMFSLLLNDLPDHVACGEVLMYADDVSVVVSAPTVDRLEQNLNNATAQVASWFKINGLILNIEKTQFIHFDLSGRGFRPLVVKDDGTEVRQVNHTTFLGFSVDRALTWEKHIDALCERLGRACFALWRVSRVLPPEMVRSCYFGTVHSLLQYGVELWGFAADWQRAFRMQKRAVRSIARIAMDESARPHFQKLRILTLPSLVILQAALYTRANLASFPTQGASHGRETRNSHKLSVPRYTLEKSARLVDVLGPRVYNRLPENVTDAPSLPSFKARLKHWLIEQTIYDVTEWLNIVK